MRKIMMFLVAIIVASSLVIGAKTQVVTDVVSTSGFTLPEGEFSTYRVTYDISKPGWYLLPSDFSVAQLSQDNILPLAQIHKADDYKYAFVPKDQKFVECKRMPNVNPLTCQLSDIFGETMSESDIEEVYLPFLSSVADWHYYSKPVKIIYDWPSFSVDKLFGLRLVPGWNVLTVPPHLANGDVELGDCEIRKAYLFDVVNQQWKKITDLMKEEYSGEGIVIKVDNGGCHFLSEKETAGVAPPSLPQ